MTPFLDKIPISKPIKLTQIDPNKAVIRKNVLPFNTFPKDVFSRQDFN